MIYGIGCDIVEIARIEKLHSDSGEKFLNKIFTKKEIELAPNDTEQKIAYLAKRFAAKEAFSKALGTGIGDEISFKEIEILNDKKGKPYINILSEKHQNFKINLSLSDEKMYAAAFVVLEKL
jgi:holo-[acyl-carrier protein] synthase